MLAKFPAELPPEYKSFLLAFAPMGDEDTLSDDEHFEFLRFLLSVYGRTIKSVVELGGKIENINCTFCS